MAITPTNEVLADAYLRHQLGLFRLSSGIRRRAIELLNQSEQDLKERIAIALSDLGDAPPSQQLLRLTALEQALRASRAASVEEAVNIITTDMRQLAVLEAGFTVSAVQEAALVQLDMVVPNANVLRALVETSPVEGRVMSGWASKVAGDDLDAIMAQIRIGITQGDTLQQLTQRVVGVRGRGGVTRRARNALATLARTASTHFATQARRLTYEENRDVIIAEVYTATFDSRTTKICFDEDGNEYPVGEGPHPPLHPNCRSIRLARVTDRLIGVRPFKASVERELLGEFAEQNQLSGRFRTRADLPRGFKGRYDAFARRRGRELTGRVPADMKGEDFLRRQSRAFQEEILGKTGARLFRDGNMPLGNFVDAIQGELTLGELASRYGEWFRRAGLNPADFI